MVLFAVASGGFVRFLGKDSSGLYVLKVGVAFMWSRVNVCHNIPSEFYYLYDMYQPVAQYSKCRQAQRAWFGSPARECHGIGTQRHLLLPEQNAIWLQQRVTEIHELYWRIYSINRCVKYILGHATCHVRMLQSVEYNIMNGPNPLFLEYNAINQFTPGILYFFQSPRTGLFSVKIQKKFLAINNFFAQWNEVRITK